MDQDLIFCQRCGAQVPRLRYCARCGAILGGTPLDEVKEHLNRFKKVKSQLFSLKEKTEGTLSKSSKVRLEFFITEVNDFIEQYESVKKDLEKKGAPQLTILPGNRTVCPNCGSQVPFVKFCQICGDPLGENPLVLTTGTLKELNDLRNVVNAFKKKVSGELSSEAKKDLADIIIEINQLIERFDAEWRSLVAIKEAPPSPTVTSPITSTKPAAPSPPSATMPSAQPPRVTPKRATIWSRLERNLLNYWLFYVAIILGGAGISVFLYFIVVEMKSEVTQLIIIFVVGAVIVTIGQILSLIGRRRKRAKEPAASKTAEDKNAKAKTKSEAAAKELWVEEEEPRKGLPVPQLATAINFIGFVVLFVGSIYALATSEYKVVFLFIGWAVGVLSIGFGAWNKSELLVIIGFLGILTTSAMGVLYGEEPIMVPLAALFAFLVPILLATLVAVFFKRWTGAVVVLAVVPIFLCIPKMIFHIGLEFLLILAIPIMIVFVIQFSSEKIPVPIRSSLVGLSLLLPTISLIFMGCFSKFLENTEAAWASLYPYEIFIASFAILGAVHYYPYIQEEHLEVGFSKDIIRIAGELLVGLVSIVTVSLYGDSISSTLFFSAYFVLGILSAVVAYREDFSAISSSVSFLLAEVQVIILFAITNPVNIADEILLFFLGGAFILLAIVSTFIPRKFHESSALFLVWNFFGGVNVTIIGLMGRINKWFVFTLLILLLLTSLIVNLPVLVPKVNNWRSYSLASLFVNAVVLLLFVTTGHLTFFPGGKSWEPLIFYIVLMVISTLAFFDWRRKEVVTVE